MEKLAGRGARARSWIGWNAPIERSKLFEWLLTHHDELMARRGGATDGMAAAVR